MTDQRHEARRRGQILFHSKFKTVTIIEGRRKLKVTPSILKGLLNVIDRHMRHSGSCYASYEALALETGLSVNSVDRGIKALCLMDLLIVTRQRKGRTFVHHREICWSNLAAFVPTQKRMRWEESEEDMPHETATIEPREPPEVGVPTDPVGVPTDPVGVPTEAGSGPHRCSLGSPQERFEVPTVGTKRIERRELHERSARTREEPRRGGTGVLKKRQEVRSGKGVCLIPNLAPDALQQPEMVQALYQVACERGFYKASQQHRLAWFSFCRQLTLWKDCDNPVGALSKVLSQGMSHAVKTIWRVYSHADEEWARRAIREYDEIDQA